MTFPLDDYGMLRVNVTRAARRRDRLARELRDCELSLATLRAELACMNVERVRAGQPVKPDAEQQAVAL